MTALVSGPGQAVQGSATLALPAVTLVLTLTVAAFTIMLRDEMGSRRDYGVVAGSWRCRSRWRSRATERAAASPRRCEDE
jgi:hypothetical protein